MKTVIMYSSKHGFTKKAAERLQTKLKGFVDVKSLDKTTERDISEYRNVIIGSPVYAGKLRHNTLKFVSENLKNFEDKNVAVFLCGKETDQTDKILKSNFPEGFNNRIKTKGHFGYGLDFENMKHVEKVAIKLLMKKADSETLFNEQNISDFADEVNLFDFIVR